MTAWTAHTTPVDERTLKLTLRTHEAPMSAAQVIAAWRDAAFAKFFAASLAQIPLQAYFWEMPALTRAGLAQPYECVAVRCHRLEGIRADPAPFREHFVPSTDAAKAVVCFPNLGGDARLIVPTPLNATEHYAHLADFLRHGPVAQIIALFRTLADTLEQELSTAPLWVSTSGLGVYWLHVRLDTRPKYYSHAPYRGSPIEHRA